MKIEGLSQVHTIDTIKANQTQTEASDFERALEKAFDEGDKKKLKAVCNDFENILLQMLYKQMKATVPDDGLTEKSTARGIFEDMLDDTMMEKASERGIGISDMMYKQLSAKMDKTYKVNEK